MIRLLLSLALLLAGLSSASAQFGSFGDVPIDITSDETGFEGGLAIAQRNVVIRYGDTVIYCDYAQYNADTRDVLVQGNVRIYRQDQQFTGERALYNLETKVLRAADFRGNFQPFSFGGDSLGSSGHQCLSGQGRRFYHQRFVKAGLRDQGPHGAHLSERPHHLPKRPPLCGSDAGLLVSLPVSVLKQGTGLFPRSRLFQHPRNLSPQPILFSRWRRTLPEPCGST